MYRGARADTAARDGARLPLALGNGGMRHALLVSVEER